MDYKASGVDIDAGNETIRRIRALSGTHNQVLAVPDPDEFTFYDRYDATAYWCTCTQKGLGPDGLSVHPSTCKHGGDRGCCE